MQYAFKTQQNILFQKTECYMMWIIILLSVLVSFETRALEIEIVKSNVPVRLVYSDLLDLDGLRIGMTMRQVTQLYEQKYPGSHVRDSRKSDMVGDPASDVKTKPYTEFLDVIGTDRTVNLAARFSSPAIGSIAVFILRHKHWTLPSEGPSLQSILQSLNQRFGEQLGSIDDQFPGENGMRIRGDWIYNADGLALCNVQNCDDLVQNEPELLDTRWLQARYDAGHAAIVEASIFADSTGAHVRDLTISIEDISNELRDRIELDKQLMTPTRGGPAP